jgi:hypothetical protein
MSNKPTTHSVTLDEDSSIQTMVNYSKEWNDQVEEGHGTHDLSGYGYSLNSVEVVIAGTGIDITKQLSVRQHQKILEEIQLLEEEMA